MKNRKIIFLAAILGLMFSTASLKAQAEGEYLIMRTVETTIFWPSQISIAYPDGKLEEIPLLGLKKKKLGENAALILKKINELKSQGYELVTSNGGNSDNAIVHTYVFKKTE
ncbi:hypothetical protein [Reichenbachiella versicolor]|uniref:hypothetical protein n=1 Tax=Reichenbachiella versicolor TaxID=1821036 RepID=UPI000D6E3CA4|nr:hypothetical protein [Reichenbachiella versicolor]